MFAFLADSRSTPFSGWRLSVRGLFERIHARDAAFRNHQRFAELDARMLRDIGVTARGRDAELRHPLPW